MPGQWRCPGRASRGSGHSLTIVLLVQTLKHQSQLLLVVLEVMDKLLKVQLPVKVLVASLHDFLEHKNRVLCLSSF